MKDNLGDRMKTYYENRTQTYLPRRTYTIIRLDGKSFHTYTRDLEKPFDAEFIEDMHFTAKYLCKNIQGCKLGYVQSDEISLLLTDFDNLGTDAWFDGNIQKITSVSAAMTSAVFNARRQVDEFGKSRQLAYFDSRVFTIPTKVEVENYFIWRQKDAIRNSISTLAQSLYSSKQLHGKSTSERLEMMKEEKGVDWESYPWWIKRGQMVVKGDSRFVLPPTPNFIEEREELQKHIPTQ